MHGYKSIYRALCALCFIVLILDSKTALIGAAKGIDLCLKAVIPALFPFFVLSSAIVSLTSSCSHSFTALLPPCFLGGYPVGAKNIHQAYTDGLLSKETAENMLAFCNNAGPAFIFGMLAPLFPQIWMTWSLWGIHLIGAMFAAIFFHFPFIESKSGITPNSQNKNPLYQAIYAISIVCGWIILFRILITFLDRWILWYVSPMIRTMIIGFLELSNGCIELSAISNISARFIVCSCFLAVGGLCITAQTISVTEGLSLKFYFWGKLIQLFVSLILSFCLMSRCFLLLLLLLPLLLPVFLKNRSGKQVLSGV